MSSLLGRKVKLLRSMPGLEVRLSEEADGEHWAAWLTERDVLRFYPMEGGEERKESVARMQSYARWRASLTAVYHGEVAGIGYLNLHPYRKIAHQAIFTIIVGEKFQGRGIGTELLGHLERMAKDSYRIEVLHLEVYEGNPAHRLYRRLGYQDFGFQSHFIREAPGEYRGKIMMEKYL